MLHELWGDINHVLLSPWQQKMYDEHLLSVFQRQDQTIELQIPVLLAVDCCWINFSFCLFAV
jgi:hypothetical protein